MDPRGWKFSVDIPFATESHAKIAKNSLQIDKEPRKGEISRTFLLNDNILSIINMSSLRKCLSSASVHKVQQLGCLHNVKENHRQFNQLHKNGQTKSFKIQSIKWYNIKTMHTTNKSCSVDTSLTDSSKFAESTVSEMNQSVLSQTQDMEKAVLSLDEMYELLLDVNGKDIVVLKLSKKVNYVDFFIIVTANSPRHLTYMSQTLNQLYKNKKSPMDPYLHIEGKNDSDSWHCIDMGHAVVHFMLQSVRDRYQLEKLWLLGPKYDELWHEVPEDTDPFSVLELHDFHEVPTEIQQEKTDFVAPWNTSFKPESDTTADVFDEEDYII